MLEKLAIISILTTLTTEAVKKLLDSFGVNYATNIITTIVGIVLTVAIQFYSYRAGIGSEAVYETVALAFLSFLTSTLGYDKVSQTIGQIRG